MAGKGIYSYTVQEGTNLGMGQAGSMYCAASKEYDAPSGQVFVSITFLDANTAFTTLQSEDDTLYINTTGTLNLDGPPGSLVTGDFPQGITIYGRWTKIEANGRMIAYLGS